MLLYALLGSVISAGFLIWEPSVFAFVITLICGGATVFGSCVAAVFLRGFGVTNKTDIISVLVAFLIGVSTIVIAFNNSPISISLKGGESSNVQSEEKR